MKCIAPVTLVKKTIGMYTDDKHTFKVPCNKCINCLKTRSAQWGFRLAEELKISSSAIFITLTYETPPISTNGLPTLDKNHFRLFMKRLRKKSKKHKIKYYVVGEYGTKFQRPHYHAIMFNIDKALLAKPQDILETWQHGQIDIGTVTDNSIHYVTNYILTKDIHVKEEHIENGIYDDRVKEYSNMSKGLGLSYLTKQMVRFYKSKKLGVLLKHNQFISMPKYYKDRIFTPYEKAQIAAEFEKQYNEEIDLDHFKNEIDRYHDTIRKHKKLQKLTR